MTRQNNGILNKWLSNCFRLNYWQGLKYLSNLFEYYKSKVSLEIWNFMDAQIIAILLVHARESYYQNGNVYNFDYNRFTRKENVKINVNTYHNFSYFDVFSFGFDATLFDTQTVSMKKIWHVFANRSKCEVVRFEIVPIGRENLNSVLITSD